jgi:hypothetical protein
MPGSIPYGFHEGGRSEQIAYPIFSAFGSAVQVPRSEDLGLDFYCALMERRHGKTRTRFQEWRPLSI